MYITIIQNQNSQFSISKHKLSITRREKKNRSSQFTESSWLFLNLDKNYSLHINIHPHTRTSQSSKIKILNSRSQNTNCPSRGEKRKTDLLNSQNHNYFTISIKIIHYTLIFIHTYTYTCIRIS